MTLRLRVPDPGYKISLNASSTFGRSFPPFHNSMYNGVWAPQRPFGVTIHISTLMLDVSFIRLPTLSFLPILRGPKLPSTDV